MEINITRFFNECVPMDYSASIAEIGINAGQDTWQAAKDDSQEYEILYMPSQRKAFREYIDEFGAWSFDEISSYDNTELNALFMQLIAGDIRESEGLTNRDWSIYESECEAGNCSSNIFKGDDGQIYFYVGY